MFSFKYLNLEAGKAVTDAPAVTADGPACGCLSGRTPARPHSRCTSAQRESLCCLIAATAPPGGTRPAPTVAVLSESSAHGPHFGVHSSKRSFQNTFGWKPPNLQGAEKAGPGFSARFNDLGLFLWALQWETCPRARRLPTRLGTGSLQFDL